MPPYRHALSLRNPLLVSRPFSRHFQYVPRRTVSQHLSSLSGEPLRLQTVRFKRPRFFTFRRLGRYLVYTGLGVVSIRYLFDYLDIEITFADEEELEEQEEASSEDEEEFFAEEDSIFIPLTWSRKLPRSYYRGSDPEWQEFLKIARDKSRHKRIQEQLVEVIFIGASQHVGITRQLGKGMSVGSYWLDINFPDGPPQEYERSGIEIGDGFVAWSHQRIGPDTQWRLTRALWPSAAANGFWEATTTFAGIQYRRVKQALGWESTDPSSPEEKYRKMLKLIEKLQQSRGGQGEVSKAQTDPTTSPSAAVVNTRTNSQSAKTEKAIPWHFPVHLPSSSDSKPNDSSSVGIPVAMHVFNHALSKSWNPNNMELPRGACLVQGLIEMKGHQGRMLLDAQGAYDPRQGKFIRVGVKVRNFQRWSQPPRGGD